MRGASRVRSGGSRAVGRFACGRAARVRSGVSRAVGRLACGRRRAEGPSARERVLGARRRGDAWRDGRPARGGSHARHRQGFARPGSVRALTSHSRAIDSAPTATRRAKGRSACGWVLGARGRGHTWRDGRPASRTLARPPSPGVRASRVGSRTHEPLARDRQRADGHSAREGALGMRMGARRARARSYVAGREAGIADARTPTIARGSRVPGRFAHSRATRARSTARRRPLGTRRGARHAEGCSARAGAVIRGGTGGRHRGRSHARHRQGFARPESIRALTSHSRAIDSAPTATRHAKGRSARADLVIRGGTGGRHRARRRGARAPTGGSRANGRLARCRSGADGHLTRGHPPGSRKWPHTWTAAWLEDRHSARRPPPGSRTATRHADRHPARGPPLGSQTATRLADGHSARGHGPTKRGWPPDSRTATRLADHHPTRRPPPDSQTTTRLADQPPGSRPAGVSRPRGWGRPGAARPAGRRCPWPPAATRPR